MYLHSSQCQKSIQLFNIGHPGDGQVEIFYVDVGNKKVVPVTDLRRIKDEFFALPIMVSCCVIHE